MVINQFNTIGTQFDTKVEFERFIDDLNETKMQTYKGNKSDAVFSVDDDNDDTTAAAAGGVAEVIELWDD